MNRERLAWIVSLFLLALLAITLPPGLNTSVSDLVWARTLLEVHNQVLNNYVDPVDDSRLREKSIEGMISALDDPYTEYFPPVNAVLLKQMLENHFTGVGIRLNGKDGRIVVLTPIAGSPADKAGVLPGDVITGVDGQAIAGWPINDVVRKISGVAGMPVTLTLQRDAQTVHLTMIRQDILEGSVEGLHRLSDETWDYTLMQNPRIGYVRITQFDQHTAADFKSVLLGDGVNHPGLVNQGMQGLILDLRFNPGGYLDAAVQVVNMFVKPNSLIVSTKGRNYPEHFAYADASDKLPAFPLIVLVNDTSASAAEIVAGSLKDNLRATLIGQRTFGKGSVQETPELSEGQLKISVAYYYLPSGRLVHRKKNQEDWGVVPNIQIPVSEADELAISEGMFRAGIVHPAPQTRPSTRPVFVDPQLHQAEITLLGLLMMSQGGAETSASATTSPAQ